MLAKTLATLVDLVINAKMILMFDPNSGDTENLNKTNSILFQNSTCKKSQ